MWSSTGVYSTSAAGIEVTKVMMKSKPTTNAILLSGFARTPFSLMRSTTRVGAASSHTVVLDADHGMRSLKVSDSRIATGNLQPGSGTRGHRPS